MTDANGPNDAGESSPPAGGVGRRDYLKAAATAAAVGATVAGTAGAADYDEIVVPAGTHERIWVENEVWENKLVDVTADGAGVQILGYDDSTIRNVGIRGPQPSEWDYGNSWMVVQAAAGSTIRVENVYMADGLEDDYGGGGIFVHRDHAGHCVIDNVHVAWSGDNGIYASGPGNGGGDGSVEIRNSLSYNNTVSQFRIGSTGSSVHDCVGYVDAETPEYREPGGSTLSRGIWHWYHDDCEVYDVDLDVNGWGPAVQAGRDGGHLYVHDSEIAGGAIEVDTGGDPDGELTTENVGDSPDLTPPAGVPMTPEEAASGGGSGGGGGGGGGVDAAPAVVEDFERGDPLTEYGGALDLYSVTSATTYEGEAALVNDGGEFGSVASTAGLGWYPARGNEVHVRFDNAADDNFVAVHLFAQSETDNPDGYSVGVSGHGAWRMWRHDGGEITQLASQDLPTADQIDGWYRAEVRSDPTTIHADLYDDATDELLASISADDATYAAGGVGFRSAGNGEVWDYAVRPVVEDFERGDPLAEYGGASDLFGVTTSTAYEGSQALVNDGGEFGSLVSTSGLGDYPARGDRFDYRFDNAADDNFVALHFFAQSETDNPDGYSVGVSGHGAWRMWRHDGGEVTRLASQDLPASEQVDSWYRAEVWTDSTTVYADLYDDATGDRLASISADDATYSSGGIGFRSAGNGEVWDYVVR